ncbi:hypothetical protein CBR_g31511 [Chara braunii]|uniref:Reverse transcriptase/retrotransposon-derived protein RNase H-like domain-containing protein n=1 Tax=Chara braunii TaxID=69332 RepID=A0A388LF67_CHABU|nr:hypothetical protein CBR_g31511 [Chara braunii]|eukprot:GBG80954.1 hypothetical protein CBR_g31511 [Chara braunii]
MSFLTERALGDHLLAPRGYISAIRQVHHPRFSLDLLRLAQLFRTTGVYAAAEFLFASNRQAVVLVEAVTVHRLSAPGVSHVSTVVSFSGDISAISPLRHTAIQTSLREWGEQLATEWNHSLSRHGDNLVPTDGIEHIEWTLGALRDAGFKIALEKSEFFLSEISFLGYVVTRGGLQPDSRKVAAVKDAPVPTSVTQVRAFLGLASYYRRFITGFVAIARPLTNLLRKDQPLSWDAECEHAFTTLKGALATTPILIQPDPTKQFILITDWQPEAISAILAQKGSDGREHVIEYASLGAVARTFHRSFSVPGRGATHVDKGRGTPCLDRVPGAAHHTSLEDGSGGRPPRIFVRISAADHWQIIVQELTIPLAQLVDNLPLDIVSQGDESPVPRVLTRTLTAYLQWSACLEEPRSKNNPPSQQGYLNPRKIIDIAFFHPRTASEDEELAIEEEEEEEKGDEEDGEEEETPKEGSYGEHSEGDQSEEDEEKEEKEEEEDLELEESEWEISAEQAEHTDVQAEDPEAARKREEIAAGKRQLKFASGANLPIADDPAKDPEPPKPEDGDPGVETSSAPARRRRSRSPSPSTSDRPPVGARTDVGHRASSPVLIPSSP